MAKGGCLGEEFSISHLQGERDPVLTRLSFIHPNRGQPGQTVRIYLQNNQRKMNWRCVAQAIQHLLCKCEALSSNTNPIIKKERKKEKNYI
jgi:hypothetical protein